MHMTIGTIVYAETKEGAKEQADNVLDKLCGDEHNFDYFTVLKGPLPASGKAGTKEIQRLHEGTKENFIRAYHNLIKELIGKTPEELFEERSGTQTFVSAKHWAWCFGQYRGSEIHLYDNDGEGIRDTSHLENALNRWTCLYDDNGENNPYADDKVWIVTADVHY